MLNINFVSGRTLIWGAVLPL